MSKPSPIDWDRLRAAREAEVESLRGLRLSEVTPSRRDFRQFLGGGRQEVAVIGTIRRRDPWSGETRDDLDVAAAAAALDETDVAALAVSTDPLFCAGRIDDLRQAAEAASAPLLRDDGLLHPLQVFHSRMHGADACIVPVAWVGDGVLAEILRTASSLHMTAILAALAPEDIGRAAAHDKALVGVWALDGDGEVDVARLERFAHDVPSRHTLVLLGDVLRAEQWGSLRGLADAALVSRLFRAASPGDVLERLASEAR